MTTSVLAGAEAVGLAYALVGEAARRIGGRVLVIKGYASDHHGLRPPRTPADVDVLVHPDDFARFVGMLEGWGWQERTPGVSPVGKQVRSTTYIHPRWSCDIDAHSWFPGFLAPAGETFGVFWDRRQEMPVAGVHVPMTDLPSSVLVAAAHALRSRPDQARHSSELGRLVAVVRSWSPGQVRELLALAEETGCATTLGPFWERAGVMPVRDHPLVTSESLGAWQKTIEGRSSSVDAWAGYILHGSPWQILSRVRAAVWLDEAYLRGSRSVAPGRWGLTRARLERLARGVWHFPGLVLAFFLGGRTVYEEVWDVAAGELDTGVGDPVRASSMQFSPPTELVVSVAAPAGEAGAPAWRISSTAAYVVSGPDRVVVLDLERPAEQPLGLAGSAAAIWRALVPASDDVPAAWVATSAVVADVAWSFGIAPERIRVDVVAFLEGLGSSGLLLSGDLPGI